MYKYNGWFSTKDIINSIINKLELNLYTVNKLDTSKNKEDEKNDDTLIYSFINREDNEFSGSVGTDGNKLSYIIY